MATPYSLYIFRRGATVWRYTDARKAITYDGNAYAPKRIRRGNWNKDLIDSTLPITVTSDDVTPVNNLFGGSVIPITLDILEAGSGTLLFSGFLTSPTWDSKEGSIIIGARGLSIKSDSDLPNQVYSPKCGHRLGDPLTCRVDLSDPAYTTTALYSEITFDSPTVLSHPKFGVDGVNNYPTLWWAGGIAECAATGEKVGIVNSAQSIGITGTITLMQPFQLAAAPNSIKVTAGCFKRKSEDCISKFDNEANFRGFRHVSRYDVNITKAG